LRTDATSLASNIFDLILLLGFMVPTNKKGHVRSFSISDQAELSDIVIRSNQRYDILIDIYQLQKELVDHWPRHRHSKEPPTDKRNEKGLMGVCVLRELAYFDVGRSFLADSLHNVYIGAFVMEKHSRHVFT
jgi:hypothetical protein